MQLVLALNGEKHEILFYTFICCTMVERFAVLQMFTTILNDVQVLHLVTKGATASFYKETDLLPKQTFGKFTSFLQS